MRIKAQSDRISQRTAGESARRLFVMATIVLAAALVGGCIVLESGEEASWLRYVLPVITVLLGAMCAALIEKESRRKSLVILLFATILLLGVIVYQDIPEHFSDTPTWPERVFFPIVNTLAAFFPSRGSFDYEPEYAVMGSSLCYYIFHYMAYFFWAWVAFAVFGGKILNWLTLVCIPYHRRAMFWGYSEAGYLLAENMLDTPPKWDDGGHHGRREPIFLLSDTMELEGETELKVFVKLQRRRFTSVNINFDSAESRRRAYRHGLWQLGGASHFFITENQEENMRMALAVCHALRRSAAHLPCITHVYVRTELPHADTFFAPMLAEINRRVTSDDGTEKIADAHRFGKIEVHIINQSAITARRFAAEHPLLDFEAIPNAATGQPPLVVDTTTESVSGRLRLLVLGLGWTGCEMLAKTVMDGQFIGQLHLDIDVIDRDFATAHGQYALIADLARRLTDGLTDIRINPEGVSDVGSEAFYQWLGKDERMLRYDRVIVALGNDDFNVSAALALHRFRLGMVSNASLLPQPIFVQVRDAERYAFYSQDPQSPLQLFGGLRQIYTMENIVNEQLDAVAQMVNYVYCHCSAAGRLSAEELRQARRNGDVHRCWASDYDLSIFNQESSRAVGAHIANIIRVAGGSEAFKSKIGQSDKSSQGDGKTETPNEHFERLAATEHLRWNAFHFMRGITPWNIEEVTAANGKLQPQGVLTRHICLLPFERLDEASARVNELRKVQGKAPNVDYRATDRMIVAHYLAILDS